jgi:DNA repair protein RadC
MGENDLTNYLHAHFESVKTVNATTEGLAAFSEPPTSPPPFEDDFFDLVAFHWTFHRIEKRSLALAETLRILKPQGRILLVEGIPVAGNERQYTHLALRQLLIERDTALHHPSFPILTADDIQRELKGAGFHHLRLQEVLQTSSKPGGDPEQKKEAQEILRKNLIPSLVQLGPRRSEFEKRMVEIKQRIERVGIEVHPFAIISGIKKVTASHLQPNLFSEKTDTASATKCEEIYKLSEGPEADDLSLEEQLLKFGAASLRTPELLAFLLSPGQPGSARELAERILHDYGSRAITGEKSPHRLKENLNVSLSTACQIIALFEIGRRFFGKSKAPILRSPEEVFNYLQPMVKLKREHFRGLFLNRQGELIDDEIIAIGNRTAARVHPREIFRRAMERNATAVILCHNHPSTDPTPSPEDIELTQRLVQAGKIVGIELLDHIIIADRTWTSFREANLL